MSLPTTLRGFPFRQQFEIFLCVPGDPKSSQATGLSAQGFCDVRRLMTERPS